jgi:predicted nucleic acid-binding protein
MPSAHRIVINTAPILAIVAALGDLSVFQLYQEVLVPCEVGQEIFAGGTDGFAIAEFEAATWLNKQNQPLTIPPLLANSLDRGEAAVIQLALNKGIQTVCIDEAAGRRIAQLSGLSLTGSIGILLKAKQRGYSFSMPQAIQKMQDRGVWLSQKVIQFTLKQAEESMDVN